MHEDPGHGLLLGDEGDDRHLAAALLAHERVHLVDFFDERGPSATGLHPQSNEVGGIGRRGQGGGKSGGFRGPCRESALAARAVRIPTVIPNEVLAAVGNVLGYLREKLEGIKDLEVDSMKANRI